MHVALRENTIRTCANYVSPCSCKSFVLFTVVYVVITIIINYNKLNLYSAITMQNMCFYRKELQLGQSQNDVQLNNLHLYVRNAFI